MLDILVIGSEGQLGLELLSRQNAIAGARFSFTRYETLDVTNTALLEQTVTERKYAYIINCTAYTAVDKAEEDSALAEKINHTALDVIGKAANSIGAKVIHVSTDYVFDGTSHTPYTELDTTNPQSVYGKTKLHGEQALLKAQPDSVVIRTSWLYSAHGNNFVKTMLKLGRERDQLGVIFDQVGTPTYAGDLAEVILNIIQKDMDHTTHFVPGIYHYSNEGVCSWYDFTLAIHELSAIECKVKPITSKEYPTPAPRPHYSVLNKQKIKDTFGISIPYWRKSLMKCLNELQKNN